MGNTQTKNLLAKALREVRTSPTSTKSLAANPAFSGQEIVGILPIDTSCTSVAELRGRLRVKEFDFKKGGRVKLNRWWYRILTKPSLFIPKPGTGDPGTTMIVRRSRCRNARNNQRLTICLRTQGGAPTVGIPEGCWAIPPHPDIYYSLSPQYYKKITSTPPADSKECRED